MISAPWDRRSPQPAYASANVTAVRPRYQAATRVPCPEGAEPDEHSRKQQTDGHVQGVAVQGDAERGCAASADG
jgi:hypothetical protein